jgi:hypothetical protein
MSAPHSYFTDRLFFVISGTWWANSARDFEPEATVTRGRLRAARCAHATL